jgi:MFS family permease
MVTLLVVYGIVSGLPLTLLALVLPHICPNMVVYVTRLGMMYACAGLGYLVSISVATALNQRTGGYLGAQIWNGVACIIAATLFFFVSLTVRKRRRLYEMGKHTKHQNKLRKLKKYSETQAFA